MSIDTSSMTENNAFKINLAEKQENGCCYSCYTLRIRSLFFSCTHTLLDCTLPLLYTSQNSHSCLELHTTFLCVQHPSKVLYAPSWPRPQLHYNLSQTARGQVCNPRLPPGQFWFTCINNYLVSSSQGPPLYRPLPECQSWRGKEDICWTQGNFYQ